MVIKRFDQVVQQSATSYYQQPIVSRRISILHATVVVFNRYRNCSRQLPVETPVRINDLLIQIPFWVGRQSFRDLISIRARELSLVSTFPHTDRQRAVVCREGCRANRALGAHGIDVQTCLIESGCHPTIPLPGELECCTDVWICLFGQSVKHSFQAFKVPRSSSGDFVVVENRTVVGGTHARSRGHSACS